MARIESEVSQYPCKWHSSLQSGIMFLYASNAMQHVTRSDQGGSASRQRVVPGVRQSPQGRTSVSKLGGSL